MAFIPTNSWTLNEDPEKRDEAQAAAAPQGGGIIGASGNATGDAPQQKGTEFATIQKYLQANQAQGGELANKLTQPMVSEATNIVDAAKGRVGEFNKAVPNLDVYGTKSALNSQYGVPDDYDTAHEYVMKFNRWNGMFTDPNRGYMGQGDLTPQEMALKNILSRNDDLPTDFRSHANIGEDLTKAIDLEQRGAALGTEAGRQELLGQLYSQGRKGKAGLARLDQAILGQSKDARSNLAAAQEKLGSVSANIEGAASEGQAKIDALRNVYAQQRKDAQGILAEVKANLERQRDAGQMPMYTTNSANGPINYYVGGQNMYNQAEGESRNKRFNDMIASRLAALGRIG